MAFGQLRTAVRLSDARLRKTLISGRQISVVARPFSSLTARPRIQPVYHTHSECQTTKPLYQLGNRRGFAVTPHGQFGATPQIQKDRPPEDDDKKDKAIAEEDAEAAEEEVDPKDKNKPKKAEPKKEEYVDEVDPALRELKKRSQEMKDRTPEEKRAELLKHSAGVAGRGNGGRRRTATSDRALLKASVPDVYPQLMALPITKRPLFPGFYKAVTIRDPNVAGAIKEMMKRGQPYIGAFLLRDENADSDTIDNIDDVYPTGVFAQITSTFPVHGEDGALTAVLYPHRRIKISNLLPRKPRTSGEEIAATTEEVTPKENVVPVEESELEIEDVTEEYEERKNKGDVVASFEEPTEEEQKQKVAAASSGQFVTSLLETHSVSIVDVDNLVDEPHDKRDPVIRAVTSEIVNAFKEVANLNPLFRDQISTFSMSQSSGNVIEEPAKLADFAAAVSTGEMHELQEVLESLSVPDRLQKSLVVLKKELMNAQLQSKISKDVEAKIQKRQREYWLMEQMKGIKRELGIESDGKEKLVEKFKEKAAKLAMPEQVRKVFDEEITKLAHLEPAASEFNVTRNYLDWLTQIPWGRRSTENYSITHAQKVLDEDHYGLEDVKDRILEFIAVGKLRGTVEGKIICFVGPPGVGKTSIGKSIARALDRQFYRFSVGGLTDVAEIKGHRRTYVGALPGRIIQALKKCQTENPLVLIDEVDKIGRGHQGDPSSALLELLDPEQNSSFLDHYMDVPVDLSKVLFVCTANMTDTIPLPLLDRMEMIELSGYVSDEKMAIADKYLAPQARAMSGLKDVDVNLTKEAIAELIKSYCRESGVRNLKKQIEKVFRKSALKIVTDLGESELSEEKAITDEGKAAIETAEKETVEKVANAEGSTKAEVTKEPAIAEKPRVGVSVPNSVHVEITKDNLKDYVGPPVFTSDRLYDVPPSGVVMGLAWTRMGGAALYVESIMETALSFTGRPALERTGSLKDVMKESAVVAYSFVKGLMAREFPENVFFEKARVHLHCPEGAVPKDGPSAGVTMATSLLSLALDHKVDPTIAMTGELTVTGKVLRIGGLREKAVAARRSGAHTIIFPADNMSDWLELPENIKEGLNGLPAAWYQDVFDVAFKDLDKDRAQGIWKKQLEESSKRHKKENAAEKD